RLPLRVREGSHPRAQRRRPDGHRAIRACQAGYAGQEGYRRMSLRVGIDIGGTFTDIVMLAPGGRVSTAKVLSTPDDYSRGIIEGLTELMETEKVDPGALSQIMHGTTVATNALLEGKGAKVALITTNGFRDVLEIRRLRMPALYDIRF